MIDLVGPFALPFMLRPLLLLVALAVAAGTIGVIVHVRRLEFIADGLTHAVFPGLVIGFALGGSSGTMPGALVAGVAAAIVLTLVARRGAGGETGIAIVLTAFFSLGIVIISSRSDYAGQLQALFFGRILAVTAGQLAMTIGTVAVAVLIVVATWRMQVLRAFDEQAARAAGIPTLWLDVALNVAVALFVVAAAASIGTLLVLAVLIVPAAAARAVTRTVGQAVAVAIAFAAITGWLGLAIAFHASVVGGVNVAPGATVAVAMIVAYLAVLTASRLLPARRPRLAAAQAAGVQ